MIDRYLAGDVPVKSKGEKLRARSKTGGRRPAKLPAAPSGPKAGASIRSMNEPITPPTPRQRRPLDVRVLDALTLRDPDPMRVVDVAFECSKPAHEIRPVLLDLFDRGLVTPEGPTRWLLTPEGRRARD